MNCNWNIGAGVLAIALTVSAGAAQQPPAKTMTHTLTMPAMDDAHFIEMMAKHHKHGIELAKIEESRGTRDDVKALAAKIRQRQEKELTELEALKARHADPAVPKEPATKGTTGRDKHVDDMQKHDEMMQKMAQASVQKIQNAPNPDVDRAFANEMATHHEMAIEMITKTTFTDPELRKLAQMMAANQKKELTQLQAIQKGK